MAKMINYDGELIRIASANKLEHSRNDVIWEAESGNWDKVIKMLNSGTSAIESIRVR